MDLYRINLNLLIALEVLLSEQSVSLAAKKLFISQAAMSNNLKKIRELFKDDILIREKNRMVLSEYARQLQPKLHQVLQEVRSLVGSCQRFDPKTSERIFKIGMSDYFSALILPVLMDVLRDHAPLVKLHIVSTHHLSSVEAFERGDYELGIGKIFDINPPIQKKLLYKDTGVCILGRNHSLSKKKRITLKEYLANKHVAVRSDNPNFPPVIEQSLAKLGVKRDIQISIPFVVPIFKLIEESDNLIGTVIRSSTHIFNEKNNFVVKPLPFPMPIIEFYLAWHQKYNNDIGHKWLRELVLDIGKGLAIRD